MEQPLNPGRHSGALLIRELFKDADSRRWREVLPPGIWVLNILGRFEMVVVFKLHLVALTNHL